MFQFKTTVEEDEGALNQVDEPLLGEDISPQRPKVSWTLYLHGALIALYTSIFIFLILITRPGVVPSCFDPALAPSNHAHKPCKIQQLTT